MATIKLSRRALLKGIGGTVLALPFLEAMSHRTPRSGAAGLTIPKRYIVCFGGQSLGGDGDPIHNMYVPDTVGPNYDLKRALAPLAGYNNIKNEISVVSGLRIPTANGGAIPAGGRSDDFHITSLSPLFSGVKSGAMTINGPTSDQIVADAIGTGTTFKSLVYRIQAAWYLNVSAPYGRDMISYRKNGNGNLFGIQASVSPRASFDALFAAFTPPDPAEAARRAFLLRQRKSVLDLVGTNTERLMGKLGTADKARLTRHLDEVRDLERRVSAIAPDAGGQCMMLPDPGADSPIGAGQDSNGGDAGFNINAGYSDEDARARVFCDLIHMSMVCGLTNVASLQFTMAQSHMNMYSLTGYPYDLHEIGHSNLGTAGVSDGIAWHMKHFGYLVSKFRDTTEDVGNMLDNMAIVFLHEGGHGLDTSSGNMNSAHSTENMACLIAGRAGGLKPGRHVKLTNKHPAQVLLTAMNAVGVTATQLGEVSGTIPELTT